jgi:hypothetical protein
MNFEETVQMTSNWYRSFYEQPDCVADTTAAQIAIYTEFAKQRGLGWAQ